MLLKQPYQMTQYFLKTIIEREKVKKKMKKHNMRKRERLKMGCKVINFFFGFFLDGSVWIQLIFIETEN